MEKLVKKVDKHKGHEGHDAGQGCNAQFQKGPLKGINNTIPTVSTDEVQNASAIATTHGVQQKKLLLLQKASAIANDRATDGNDVQFQSNFQHNSGTDVQHANQQGMSSAIVAKSKSWADRVEEQEDDPAVVHSNQQQIVGTIDPNNEVHFHTSVIISVEERKLLDSMEGNNVVSRDDRGYESNEELSTPEEVGSSSNLNVTNNVFIPYSRQLLINSGQKQMRLSSTIDLLSHDRQLLDAMLNTDPFDILGRDPYSANRGNRSRNEVYRQQQSKPIYVKSQDEPNLDVQGVLDMPNQRTADNDTVVEGEVIEGLP
uniref:Uncharacterized protein LOC104224096 n=1 Tax=Nicotiana sylvestris TaxID=4096 RepID=A0A1U7WH58_NICSY|nr:PREDICTED: uncharacterized protein LOC104224096 [Nicotiana sylvestris]